MAEALEESYIQASFFTKEDRYAIPKTPFSLPVSASRDDLTQLVNQLLEEANDVWAQKEFDFLINQTLLHKTLGNIIENLKLQTENVIDIEYMERSPPPSLDKEFPHEDWVSAVACNDHYILTGSYDSKVRIWSHRGKLIATVSGHECEITDVAWLPPDPTSCDKNMTFISSSRDQHIHIWKFIPSAKEAILLHVCKGHSRSVEAIAPNPDARKFCSAGWDNYIKIWSTFGEGTDGTVEEDGGASKKPRLSMSSHTPSSRVPIATLSGHTHSITCVKWREEEEFISGGYDHCIRIWDSSMGVNKTTLNGSKVFLHLDKKPSCYMIASGHSDRHIRIWDTRSTGISLVCSSLSSHRGWVKKVAWSTLSDHQLVSGSYDNQAKLWDVRNPKEPLFTIAAHEDKVLCLDWSLPKLLATGGADSALRTYSFT